MRRAVFLALFAATAAQAATKIAIVGPERILPSSLRRESLEMAAGHAGILVVWRELIASVVGEHVIGALIDFDGQPIVPRIDIMRGDSPRITFDGGRFIVLGSVPNAQTATLNAQIVDEAGALSGAPFTITQNEQTVVDFNITQAVPGAIARTVVAWPESGLRAGTIFGAALTTNVLLGDASEVVTGGTEPRTVAVAVTQTAATLVARVSQIGNLHGVFATIADGTLTKTAAVTLDAQDVASNKITTGATDDLDAAAGDDAFAVVWATPADPEFIRTVRFARITPNGTVTANKVVALAGESPRVAWTGSDFVVVWRQPEGGVYGIALDALGIVEGGPFLIAPAPAGFPRLQAITAVNGGAVVAYGYSDGTAAVRTIAIIPVRRRVVRH